MQGSIKLLGTGSRGIQRYVNCPERELRGSQSKQSLLLDGVRSALSLAYEGDFKTIDTGKPSRIGHLIERASDRGKWSVPGWRKKNVPAPKKTWPH